MDFPDSTDQNLTAPVGSPRGNLPTHGWPDGHCATVVGRRNRLSIRTDRHVPAHPAFGKGKAQEFLSSRGCPDLDRSILAGGEDTGIVGAEGDASDKTSVAAEFLKEIPRGGVPDP